MLQHQRFWGGWNVSMALVKFPPPPQHRVVLVGGPLAEPAEELLQLGRQLRVPLPEAQGPVLSSHPDERDHCRHTGTNVCLEPMSAEGAPTLTSAHFTELS